MKLDTRSAWIHCSLIAALLLAAFGARAEDMCLPLAQGVPGMSNQPPDWSAAGGPFGKQLNDPRWTGATRLELPIVGGGVTPEVAFRGLYSGTKIYWSLQARVDIDGVTPGNVAASVPGDSVYVGFATGSPPTKARILKIQFKTGGTLAGDVAAANRDQVVWDWNGTTWSLNAGLPEAWTTADPNAVGLWSVVSATPNVDTIPDLVANTWAINVTYDTAAGSPLGTELGGLVSYVWYQVARYEPGFPNAVLTAREKWPPASDGWDETSLTNDVTKWGPLRLGTTDPACPGGIDIAPQAIGTAPDVAGMPGSTVHWGTAAAQNTFEAYPSFAGSGVAPSAGVIKASFRIADWGSAIGDSTTSWKNIVPAPGTVDCDATGKILWPCGPGGAACPTLTGGASAVPDQCMLVQLFVGSGPAAASVHFLRDSARRNLRFVHLSKFEDQARISVEGLAPLAGTTDRDVYIYIKTHNMPATTTNKNPPPDLKTVLNPPRSPAKGDARTNATGQPGAAAALEVPFFDRVASALPTYEIHVYHTTGKEWTVGGKHVIGIEPQVPYGYVALHDTTPDGWRHSIEALGGVTLEEIVPNFYHVKVPNNGSILVNTKIATCERRFFGLFRCCCNLGRTSESGGETALAALGLGLLFVRIVRRRQR